ncbi:hypothetical protein CHH51_01470 [Terribacillus saccharophilus]|nr:hypothetical protein CHH51_01470 [Terribacillus saccharophilus]
MVLEVVGMLGRIYDPLETKAYNLTGFDKMTRTRRVNGEKALTFDLHKTPANAHWFDQLSHMWRVDWMGEKYIAPLIGDATEGNSYVRQVDAIYRLYDDLRNDRIYETFSGSRTFDAMMNFILGGSGYTFSTADFFKAQDFENFGNDFRSELFFTALERYGAEFTESGMHITFRAKIGNETDYQYRHKFNIESVERQIDALDFSTYARFEGKDGLVAEYTSPLADMYPLSNGGYRHANSGEPDDRVTNYDTLYARAKKAVDDSLKIAITFKFEDMRAAGYNRAVPKEGDSVLMVEDRLGLKIRTRIVEIVEVFDANGNVIDCDVTLSNFTNLTEQKKRQEKAIADITDIMEGNKSIPFAALDRELQRLANQIFATESQVEYNENGIVARTKNNPDHMLILNSAGLLISLDGGKTARLAITADGIATELLTAGSIYTNNIKIVGDGDYFYWDGSGLYAINKQDETRRVVINSNGIRVDYGMIEVKGEAGTVIIDGTSNMHKILATGVVQMNTAAGDNYASLSVYHGLGYTPAFSCYMQGDSTQPDENGMSFVLPRHILGSASGGLNLLSLVRAEADPNRLYIRVHRANDYAAGLPAKTLTFRYFIYKEVAF